MMLICSFCDGVGKMEGPEICPDCKGKGKVRSTCDHVWQFLKREDSRSYMDDICIICGLKRMRAAAAIAAPVAAPILEPIMHKKETVTVNLGGGTKVSISMDEIRKQLQRDLFASAGIQGSLLDRRI
jgi:hypothetical protein